jgi:hypothetical protein
VSVEKEGFLQLGVSTYGGSGKALVLCHVICV